MDNHNGNLVRWRFGARAERMAAQLGQLDRSLALMIQMAGPGAGETMLDVATGVGAVAFAFAPLVPSVTGVDFTPELISRASAEAARRGLANLRFQLGDATALPFPGHSFDIVACRKSLHHMTEVETAVGEMARVLKDGGRLVLYDSSGPEAAEDRRLYDQIERLRQPAHLEVFSPGQIQGYCVAAGLRVHATEAMISHFRFDEWAHDVATRPGAREQLLDLLQGEAGRRAGLALVHRQGQLGLDHPDVAILAVKD